MKHRMRIALSAALWVVALGGPAWSSVPLNTGYNNANNSLFPIGAQDSYWLTIASYPTPQTTTQSWVVPMVTGWLPPQPMSRWISQNSTANSAPGTNPADPAYAIFRKCFCLLPGFQNPQLRFGLRADDNVQVWLNTQLTQLVAPQAGRFGGGAPIVGATNNPNHFRVGRNCLYVLVEDDQGGVTGFDLAGSVDALGIFTLPSLRNELECGCSPPRGSVRRALNEDDREVIDALIGIAEERRLEKMLGLTDSH
jgi:hypothetical protein